MGVVFVEEIKGRYTFVLACCVVWCYVVLCVVCCVLWFHHFLLLCWSVGGVVVD